MTSISNSNVLKPAAIFTLTMSGGFFGGIQTANARQIPQQPKTGSQSASMIRMPSRSFLQNLSVKELTGHTRRLAGKSEQGAKDLLTTSWDLAAQGLESRALLAKGGGGGAGAAAFAVGDDDDYSGSSGGGGCFSLESASVDVMTDLGTITSKPLSALKKGDQVVVDFKSQGVPEVKTFEGQFFHLAQKETFDFVQLSIGGSDDQLTLTANHYLTVVEDGQEKQKMAGAVRFGDTLKHDGETVSVVGVKAVKETGVSAPQVDGRKIAINGFSASTISGVPSAQGEVVPFAVVAAAEEASEAATAFLFGADAVESTEANPEVHLLGEDTVNEVLSLYKSVIKERPGPEDGR